MALAQLDSMSAEVAPAYVRQKPEQTMLCQQCALQASVAFCTSCDARRICGHIFRPTLSEAD